MSVPKLRFPEFRDAGEWEIKPLKSICSMQAGKFISASNIFEKGKGGIYPCYGGNGLRGYTKTYTHSGRYSLIGRQGALCGNVNLANGDFYATEHAVVVTPKQDINVNWLFYKLDLLNLNKYATGQAQPGLSVEVLEKVQCIVPTKESEQQKIADCLSSIDDRITLEAQKLDTLKAHKKGLMQQLFPAEGENLPKLRFPEFQDAGEWEVKELSQVCQVNPSVNNLPETFVYIDLESVDSGNLHQKKVISREGAPSRAQRLLKRHDVIFQMVRPYQRNNYYFDANDDISYVASTGYAQLRAHDSSLYLFQYLHNDNFVDRVLAKCTGSNYPAINSSDLSKILVEIPTLSEQQKIADCLTSIDEAIAAQSEAIDLLKLHKKGLMQQLFPSVEEVRG